MSVPRIPGYLDSPDASNLLALWLKPDSAYPPQLWPTTILAEIAPDPTGWVTVEETYFNDGVHGGRAAVVVQSGARIALESTSWVGTELGGVGIWNEDTFHDGLSASDGDVTTEFFVHARRPSGSTKPIVELCLPFLWYWDAFSVVDGWHYLNRAGRTQELVRWELTEDSWKVQVRALELHQYLAARSQDIVVQVDVVTKVAAPEFDRVDADFQNEWAHFDIHIVHDRGMRETPAFSRLLGQYVVSGLVNSRLPRWQERREDRQYPEFVYGIDAATGQPLKHHCDPDNLGTYFDQDGTRLHYLTPNRFQTRGIASIRSGAGAVPRVGFPPVVPRLVGHRHLDQQRWPSRGVPGRPRPRSSVRRVEPLDHLRGLPRAKWRKADSVETSLVSGRTPKTPPATFNAQERRLPRPQRYTSAREYGARLMVKSGGNSIR